jgi:oligogalacturonide transporter
MEKKVSFKNMIGYASINFLGSGSQKLVQLYLTIFYTQLCDLSIVQAGLIFTVTRFLDAILNPIMGFISDNFGRNKLGKRFGRRKFFVLIGAPLSLLVYPLLWVTGQSFAYYFAMNMVWEMVFTMIIVSAIALPAEMAQSAADKTKLVAAKSYCGTLAQTIAAAVPAYIFGMYGENNPTSFLLTGVVYGAVLAVSLLVVYAFTFERDPKDIVYGDEMVGVGQVLKKLLIDTSSSVKVKSFRLHTIMMLTIGVYKNLAATVFTYYVIYCLSLTKAATGYISAFSTFITFGALTVFVGLAYKYGGPKTFRISSTLVMIGCVGSFGLMFMKGSSLLIPALVVVQLFNEIGKGGVDYIPVFQLPFMADIDEAVTGTRREGILSGVNGAMSKVSYGIEQLLLTVVLAAFGFVKGTGEQPQSAVIGIGVMAIAFPLVLLGITWVVSIKLKLTKENHKVLIDEVNRVKAGGAKSEVTQEAKAAIEELTGFAYENCFGNNNVLYNSKKTVNA